MRALSVSRGMIRPGIQETVFRGVLCRSFHQNPWNRETGRRYMIIREGKGHYDGKHGFRGDN